MSRDGLVLLAILGLAAGLRLWGLDGQLWYDEILTLETHLVLPWAEMMSAYAMNHHHFYSFAAKAAMALLGDSPWVLRLPAFVFGLGSIALVWLLARRVAGAATAHVTALLMALSFHHVWFSQNARGYTELLFWSMAGALLFLAGVRRPRPAVWAGFGLVLAAATWTHLSGIFFFVAAGLVWLGRLPALAHAGALRREDLVWPAAGFAGGGLLALLLLAPLLPGILAAADGVAESSAVDAMQEYQSPLWTALEALHTLAGQEGPLMLLLALAAPPLLLIGAVRLHRREPLLVPLLLLHMAVTAGILLALGMRLWPRFFFVDIGLLVLMLVLGVEGIAAWLARRLPPGLSAGRLMGLATLAMAAASLLLAARNWQMPKQDLAGPVALIATAAEPGDRVYAVGVVGTVYAGHFATGWGTIRSDAELAAALARPGRIWLVVGFPGRSFRAIAGLGAAVDEAGFGLVRRFPGSLGDGTMLVFARPAPAEGGNDPAAARPAPAPAG
jgi:hypothetical protein